MNMCSFFFLFPMLLAFSVVQFSSADWFVGWEHRNGLDIMCPQGQVVNEIRFSSYGLSRLPKSVITRNGKQTGIRWGSRRGVPTTDGPKAITSSCHAWNTFLVVHKMCMSKEFCHIEVDNFVFGDPCRGKIKYLAVDVVCSKPASCGLNQPSRLIAAEYCSHNSVPHGLYIAPGHSLQGLWSGGIDWVSAGFVEKSNGDAEISGVLTDSNNRWNLSVSLWGRQPSESGLTPLKENQGRCRGFNSDAWYFYHSLSGSLFKADTGEKFEINMNSAHPAQVGKFANLKNGNPGISFWMHIKDSNGKVANADLNSDIICGLAPTPQPTPTPHRRISRS